MASNSRALNDELDSFATYWMSCLCTLGQSLVGQQLQGMFTKKNKLFLRERDFSTLTLQSIPEKGLNQEHQITLQICAVHV